MYNKRYLITGLGHILSIFILMYLDKFINYDFTSEMENNLDKIANGEMKLEDMLIKFISQFNDNMNKIYQLSRSHILENIEKYILDNYVKTCKKCNTNLKLRFFRNKPYMCCLCNNYNINSIGYKEEENIPNLVEYSKNKQYFKKVIKDNYKKI